MEVRLSLISQDDHFILRSKKKPDEYIVLDLAQTANRAAHFSRRASASNLKAFKLYGISTGKSAATFGALGDAGKALRLEVADWRTTDPEGLGELTLPPTNDIAEANGVLQACLESLHDDVKDTAVLRGVAVVCWAEDENPLTAATWTLLPLATLQRCKDELMPLLLSLLRQCEPRLARQVTVGFRSRVAHLLISVSDEDVDWTGADGQGRLLTFLDPVHDNGKCSWKDAKGQERWADNADLQVFLPQTDPNACVTPASRLHGVRLLLDGDYRELAEVTLQRAAEACSDGGHGLLCYRQINLLDEHQGWLRDAFIKRGWWPGDSNEAPEVWASASADEPLLITRRQEDPPPEPTVTSAGAGDMARQQQGLQVVRTLRKEECQELLREAHASPGGPKLALVPDALNMLVHRHYLALPYSRGLLEQADNNIMQMHDISKQRHREKAVVAAAASRVAAAPSAAAAAPAPDVQSAEHEGGRRESCRHKQLKECANCHVTSTPQWRRDKQQQSSGNALPLLCNACWAYRKAHRCQRPPNLWNTGYSKQADGAGPSGNQQARAKAARAPKRDTPRQVPDESHGGDSDRAEGKKRAVSPDEGNPSAKRLRQASGSMDGSGTPRKELSAQAGPQGRSAVRPLSTGGAAGTGHVGQPLAGHAGAEPQGQVPPPGREAEPQEQQQAGAADVRRKAASTEAEVEEGLAANAGANAQPQGLMSPGCEADSLQQQQQQQQQQQAGSGVGRRQATEGEAEVAEPVKGSIGQHLGSAYAEAGRHSDQPKTSDVGAGSQRHALASQRGVEPLAGQQQQQLSAGGASAANSLSGQASGVAQAELLGREMEVEERLAADGETGAGNEGRVPDRAVGRADQIPAPGGHPNGSQNQQAGDTDAGPQGSALRPEHEAEALAGLLQQQLVAEAAAPPQRQQGESEAESGLLAVVEQHAQGRARGAEGSRAASASAPAALDAHGGGLAPPGAGDPLLEHVRQLARQERAAQASRMQLVAQLEQASRHLQEEQQRFRASRAAAEAHDKELQQQVKQERAAMEQKVKEMQLQLGQGQAALLQSQQLLEQERAARVAAEKDAKAVLGERDEVQLQLASEGAAAKALHEQVLRLQGELQQQQVANEAAEREGKVLLEEREKLRGQLQQERSAREAAKQDAELQREGCNKLQGQLEQEVAAHKELLTKHALLVERHKDVLKKQTELLAEKGALQQKLLDTEQKLLSAELKSLGAP